MLNEHEVDWKNPCGVLHQQHPTIDIINYNIYIIRTNEQKYPSSTFNYCDLVVDGSCNGSKILLIARQLNIRFKKK